MMTSASPNDTSPPDHAPSNPHSSSTTSQTINIGTRSSALALLQTSLVHTLLHTANPSLTFQIHSMATLGDKDKTTALYAFNAKALWTHELEARLLSHDLDLIVHSLKDMPTQLPTGCLLGAVLDRTERRDCVVMSKKSAAEGKKRLEDLKHGEVVGTSSVRRAAQIRRKYPGLVVKDVRGNVDTRVRKLDDEEKGYSCLILAAAGIQRMGMGERVSGYLSGKDGGMLGAVGQGALGIEVRDGDERVMGVVRGLVDRKAFLECLAERSLLRTLEGGCSVPIGVETEWVAAERGEGVESGRADDNGSTKENDILLMRAIVVSVDGSKAVEGERRQQVRTEEEADECGWNMAQELVEKGAGSILDEIRLNRAIIEQQDGA